MFALIDCNNFFVSCEKVFKPNLENKPVIVLSSNDGCIVARSNEAKLLGIPMGVPLFEVRHLVKSYNIETLSCNFELYADMSKRIMNILQQLCKNVEVYSIDEAFLTFEPAIDWNREGDRISQYIFQCTGIPTSIGFGPTKTFAKLANTQAKITGLPCYIDNTSSYHKILKETPASNVWGIGNKLTKNLKQHGIYSVYDLMTAKPGWIRHSYNIAVERIVRELNGFSCIPSALTPEPKKSLQITRSFSQPVKKLENLKQIVARYSFRLSTKLRESSQMTSTILVYAQNSSFSDEAPIFQQHTIILEKPTNNTSIIVRQSQNAIEQLFDPTISYKKVGIIAVDLRDITTPNTLSIFNAAKTLLKKSDIDKVMDTLNKKFGLGTVRPLSCGSSIEWKNKHGNKTPAYTTRWKNIAQVKAQ